jgi:hypothetical protein
MPFSKAFALALSLSLLTLAATAGAQTKEDSYTYRYDDDLMVGDTFSTPPPLLRLRRTSPRITLLRPRAAFVAEMLKSVEAL